MPNDRRVVPFLSLILLLTLLFAYTRLPSYARQPAQAGGAAAPTAGSCPGERMDVQATGVYQSRPWPAAVINGEPWGGAYWGPGMRSYWHCHPGGQMMMVMSGEGRVQKRGERMRSLAVGESEYAAPWVEHWHGAAPDSLAHYVQVSLQPTGTLWMEETSQADYLGNDIGIVTRNQFLRTGVREQQNSP